jgi:endo-beta-N-acetylglucosaminidase D
MTKNGDIRWQNTLNDMNSEFFNATDGIFTNYCWKADTPAAAYEKVKEMGRQSNEVYMGSDVWGRGSFASGFETWKVSTDTVQRQHIYSQLTGTDIV